MNKTKRPVKSTHRPNHSILLDRTPLHLPCAHLARTHNAHNLRKHRSRQCCTSTTCLFATPHEEHTHKRIWRNQSIAMEGPEYIFPPSLVKETVRGHPRVRVCVRMRFLPSAHAPSDARPPRGTYLDWQRRCFGPLIQST